MKRYGIIDIGSNTVRLEIYNHDNGELNLFFKKKENLGLASYILNGVLSEKGLNRLIFVLKDFVNVCANISTEDVFIFATAAIRNSRNVKTILNDIHEATGLKVDLLSGEREAELGYRAVTDSFGVDSGLNIDIGGGSTELTIFEEGQFKLSNSMDKGSLSMYTMYVEKIIPTKKEAKKIRKQVRRYLVEQGFSEEKRRQITGVGGTIRLTGRLIREYFNHEVKTYFKAKELEYIVKKLIKYDKEAIRTLLQLSPDRIHTLVPGALILLEICRYFKVKEILVSESGVRTGYLLEKLNN